MAYELVKFKDDADNEVTITPADVLTFCPTATDQDVKRFIALCATKHLNMFTGEAYLVKYGNNPAQCITARVAFQKRADQDPNYDGTEIGVVVLCQDGSIQRIQGEAYYPAAGQQLIGGWARVHRKDREYSFYTEVARQEYDTGKGNWGRMPGTMISKVAEVHALRMAFPNAFDGMYTEEEMAQAVPSTSEPVSPTSGPVSEVVVQGTYEAPQGPTEDEKLELRNLTQNMTAMGYDERDSKRRVFEAYKGGGMEAARQYVASAMDSMAPEEIRL